jgi:putative ATPase
MKPLADLIRPQTLDEFIGQKHLTGESGFIRKLLERKPTLFPSLIFWGPPGCGKTTLARIIAHHLGVTFKEFSAVSAKKSQLQEIFTPPKANPQGNFLSRPAPSDSKPPIVFLDEIHRFSKAQQDVLLSPTEQGKITLIAATTENPSFYVISPLLSRCQTLIFNPLSSNELLTIAQHGLKKLKRKITDKAQEIIIKIANGDARIVLNLLEQASQITPADKPIDKQTIERIITSTTLRYDKTGEEHYNTISAFIKSMRASDPNAALYYLARMIESGEDPLFIARRLVIFASEDVGLADPKALPLAVATFHACQQIGLPEAQINLAHATTYLAKAPKSRHAYNAYFAAKDDVKEYGNLPIPLELRNPVTKLMKQVGYGKGYKMYPKNKSLLPKKLKEKKYLK